jgi:hypothetical protein
VRLGMAESEAGVCRGEVGRTKAVGLQ